MFDKLIESEPEGADFKNRRGFFVLSTVVVGILFLTAVVISIYAEDFALGKERMELEAMLAPVEPAATEPEPPRLKSQAAPNREQSDQTSRVMKQARTDEFQFVPTSISSEPNRYLSRTLGDIHLSDRDTDPIGSGRTENGGGPGGSGLEVSQPVAEKEPNPEPPAVKDPPPVKPPPVQSLGVINGRASYLPKPPYPAAALAVNAGGSVDVQVLIDESGRVVSAKAVSGNPLLRGVAEQSARNAKFTPTYLSNVAVKVSGMIVYNFTRN